MSIPEGMAERQAEIVADAATSLDSVRAYYQRRSGHFGILLDTLKDDLGKVMETVQYHSRAIGDARFREQNLNQLYAAQLANQANLLQEYLGVAMPGTWPPPEPVRAPTLTREDAEVVATINGLREYGDCPDQRAYKRRVLEPFVGRL